eukprot:5394749-Pyramimonas_sp.AAC.1
MGRFWQAPNIPYKWKRCVLLCHVVNSALSAVECFIPSTGQLRKLELAVAGLCRRAMRGKASWEDAHHVRSLSSQQVLEYWKIIPLCVELRVRRLK